MVLLVAIHGILTSQTDASWVDRLDAWALDHAPDIRVHPEEYSAGPFPRFNTWFKDPALARGLAYEIDLCYQEVPDLRLWFVAHSNGCIIAIKTLQILTHHMGHAVEGAILVGGACDSDVNRSGVFDLVHPPGSLPARLSQCVCWHNHGDLAVPCREARPGALGRLRGVFYRWLAAPYGGLGHEGFTHHRAPWKSTRISNEPWPDSTGHSGYWSSEQRETTFERIAATVRGC